MNLSLVSADAVSPQTQQQQRAMVDQMRMVELQVIRAVPCLSRPELRPSFDTPDANQRTNWQARMSGMNMFETPGRDTNPQSPPGSSPSHPSGNAAAAASAGLGGPGRRLFEEPKE